MRDQAGGQPPAEEEAAPLPHPRDFVAALGLLSALPLPRPDVHSPAFARATLFFPVAGALLGCTLIGVHWACARWLPAWAMAVVLTVLWEAASGGAGLRACGAAAGGRAGRTVLMVAALTAKAGALTVAAAAQPVIVLFAPLLARWGIVVLAAGARDAAAAGRKFNAAVGFREFALTSVLTFALLFSVAEATGMLIVVCTAAAALGLRVWHHRRPGGVSWPLLLADAELLEILVAVLIAALRAR